jgi:hypothetical protein
VSRTILPRRIGTIFRSRTEASSYSLEWLYYPEHISECHDDMRTSESMLPSIPLHDMLGAAG